MRDFDFVVVEGDLEGSVIRKIFYSLNLKARFPIKNKRGERTFWKDIDKYNNASKKLLVLGLVDLEGFPCPSGLIQKYLKNRKNPNFTLRIAERMLESWLLSDRKAMSKFLKISIDLIPKNPDQEQNPKQTLVNLARKSNDLALKKDLVPETGSKGIVGKDYIHRMTQFIEHQWNPLSARKASPSLDRALRAIQKAIHS